MSIFLHRLETRAIIPAELIADAGAPAAQPGRGRPKHCVHVERRITPRAAPICYRADQRLIGSNEQGDARAADLGIEALTTAALLESSSPRHPGFAGEFWHLEELANWLFSNGRKRVRSDRASVAPTEGLPGTPTKAQGNVSVSLAVVVTSPVSVLACRSKSIFRAPS